MAMFEQTFVDGEGKTNKGWTVILSFAFQFLLTGILILIPLIYTDVLPQAQYALSPSAHLARPCTASVHG